MNFLVVTGISGAGMSHTRRTLEDFGYFCMDNILPDMMARFALTGAAERDVAVVIDARSHAYFGDFGRALSALRERSDPVRLLYLDADDATLLRRYKETRRRHPLIDADGCDTVEKAIARERALLAPLREQADFLVDTSRLTPLMLREHLAELFLRPLQSAMTVSIISFGFKYGLPAEADLVFDMRCLPNPFYVPELKARTGQDAEVSDYVFAAPQSAQMLEKVLGFVRFSLPLYAAEGKARLVVAIGCTGGRHRSVAVAERLACALAGDGVRPLVSHRDAAR